MAAPVDSAHRFPGISARAFEHPADRAASAALGMVPMLDTVVRKLIELQYERALRQELLASSIRLGHRQLPEVHGRYVEALRILDLAIEPDLYLAQVPYANAGAIGANDPMVLVNSRLIELLDADEQRVVFGHEAAHLLADHVLYRTALIILLRLTPTGRLPALANLPLLGVQYALLEWFRAAELSCDRAAALVAGDPLLVCRTLMVLAGGATSRKLSLDAFVAQSAEYEDWDSGWDKVTRLGREINLTHAYPVRRVRELMRWVQSGDYDRIMKGEYLRRDQEQPTARAEASDAVNFYAERFRAAIRDASDSVGKAGEKLADWLRG